jgi:hypothetical protein
MQVQKESDRTTAMSTAPLRRHQTPTPAEKNRPLSETMLMEPAGKTEGFNDSTSGDATYRKCNTFNDEPNTPSMTRTSTSVTFVVRGTRQLTTWETPAYIHGTEESSKLNEQLQVLLKLFKEVRSLIGYPPVIEPVEGSSFINENPFLNSKPSSSLLNPLDLSRTIKLETRARETEGVSQTKEKLLFMLASDTNRLSKTQSTPLKKLYATTLDLVTITTFVPPCK